MKTLNVKPTTNKELYEKWGIELPATYYGHKLFIRCNSKGDINWDKAPVYTLQELQSRENVNYLNQN